MKTIFRGKKKYLTIPLVGTLALVFLPLIIIFLIFWVTRSKVHNQKIRTAIYAILGLIALPFVAAYAVAFTSPPTLKTNPVPTSRAETIAADTETNTRVLISTPEAQTDLFKVTRVIDGDTFEIEGGQRIRMIGMDTPELSGTIECYAREAYDRAMELIDGKAVRLEKDVSETDKYGRLLRYVYVDDIFVNKLLVEEGFANAASYPPDVKYQQDLRQAEQEARSLSNGFWKGCATPKPVSTPKPTIKPVATALPITNSGGNSTVTTQQPSGGTYACNCSKTCTQISSCAEAQYQLNVCGCGQRDGDDDGIACDGAPLHCQN